MEKKKDDNPLPFAMFMGVLLLIAVVSKHEAEIRYWFYDHLMLFVLAAFALISIVVAKVLRNFKKKNSDALARQQAVRMLRPSGRSRDYFERRN